MFSVIQIIFLLETIEQQNSKMGDNSGEKLAFLKVSILR